jgi:hypothetical protein
VNGRDAIGHTADRARQPGQHIPVRMLSPWSDLAELGEPGPLV